MFRFVGAVALDTFSSLESVWEHCMFPLSAVLTLRGVWVHVGIPNSSNVFFYVEVSVNEFFSLTTILDISYVDPDNGYVWSGEYIDDMRSEC